jgi:iron complex transport system substrate-binding protein
MLSPMRTRVGRKWLWILLLLVSVGVAHPPGGRAEDGVAGQGTLRLVSLNPSLTSIILRLGGGDSLVGVDDYSARILPEVSDRPNVGGLFDPSLESVVALRPDRILMVAGVDQQSHGARLEKLGLEVEVFPNQKLEEVLENIERLGALLGRSAAARDRIRAITDTRSAVAEATRNHPAQPTIAVVTRSPLFIVGGDTFLDEMLEVVGARNLGRDLAKGYPRASIEWLIGIRPELLLDLTPDVEPAAAFWSRWPSLPAVAGNRVVEVDASRISLPGPDLDRALKELAIAVHGPDISMSIDAALRKQRATVAADVLGFPQEDSIR